MSNVPVVDLSTFTIRAKVKMGTAEESFLPLYRALQKELGLDESLKPFEGGGWNYLNDKAKGALDGRLGVLRVEKKKRGGQSFDAVVVRYVALRGEELVAWSSDLSLEFPHAPMGVSFHDAYGVPVALSDEVRAKVKALAGPKVKKPKEAPQPVLVEESPVRAATLSADGTLLVSSAQKGTVSVWRASNGSPAMRVRVSTATRTVWAMALSPDGSQLAAGTSGFRVWNVPSGDLAATVDLPANATLQGLAWTSHGIVAVSDTYAARKADAVTLWDVDTGAKRAGWTLADASGVRAHGHRAVVLAAGAVMVVDAKTATAARFDVPEGVFGVDLCDRGVWVARERSLTLHDAESFAPIVTHALDHRASWFASDGAGETVVMSRFDVVEPDGTYSTRVMVHDATTWAERASWRPSGGVKGVTRPELMGLAMSDDGTRIGAGGGWNLWLWDATGAELVTPREG